MPTHVYANNNEIASKGADGKSIAALPDLCFTPPAPPVGPIPIPYPNTCEIKDLDKGTAKVLIKDQMVGMEGDSYVSKSMGDEGATPSQGKGLVSGAIQGKGIFKVWSMDVKAEGKGVPRHLDMMTHNHGSEPGNGACGADIDNFTTNTCSPQQEEKKEEENPEEKKKIHVPVILIPGFMGSVLESKNGKKILWSINNSRAVAGIIGCVITTGSKNRLSRVQDHFCAEKVQAFKESKKTGKDKHTFNWKSTLLFRMYDATFSRMSNIFAGLTNEEDSDQDKALDLLKKQIKDFSIYKGGAALDTSVVQSNKEKLKDYTFDVWGCGYNWLQSNVKSAEDVGEFITGDVKQYYIDNEYECLGSTENIQVFLVTHSMGGLVVRNLAEDPKNAQYQKHIKGVVYGGIPLTGAAAFYYAAQVGLKYLWEGFPAGLMRKFTDTILSQSPGCLELLPAIDQYNNPPCTPHAKDTTILSLQKNSDFTHFENWIHIHKDIKLSKNDADYDIYDLYKEKTTIGIYPEFENITTKRPLEAGKLTDARDNFNSNIDNVKKFHKDMSEFKFSKNAYYLWGNSLEKGLTVGELLFNYKNSKIIQKTLFHSGDGTVPIASWISKTADIDAKKIIIYKKSKSTKGENTRERTFKHKGMFRKHPVLNFTCYAIIDMLFQS